MALDEQKHHTQSVYIEGKFVGALANPTLPDSGSDKARESTGPAFERACPSSE